MSLFDSLGSGNRPQMPDRAQIQQVANQLQNDPVGFLSNMGFNIPGGLDLRNPNTIINYLVQSRQVNGGLLEMAQQLMRMFK